MEQKRYLARWRLLSACNFKCKYCSAKPTLFRKSCNTIKPVSYLNNMCRILRETKKEWTVYITGGEPFLYPDFSELCRKLTEHFRISIGSNLSLREPIRHFADTIMPEKVEKIVASLHIEELEKKGGIEDFIENVNCLKRKGFNFTVLYVLHPTLIARFRKDYEFFQSFGIRLLPKPFKGWYERKMYPQAYSRNEKGLLLAYRPHTVFYPFCFRGHKCDAGRTYIRIEPEGMVTRCENDLTVLGSMTNGITLNNDREPCKAYRCSCNGYELIGKNPFERDKSNFNVFHYTVWRIHTGRKYMGKRLRNIFNLKK